MAASATASAAPAAAPAPTPAPAAAQAQSLYGLSQDAAALVAALQEAAEGLADPEAEADAIAQVEQLLGLQEATGRALYAKADRAAWAVHALRDRAEIQKGHARRLADAARATEREAERLEAYLVESLRRAEPDSLRFDLGDNRIQSRRSERLEIEEDAQVPAAYLKEPEVNTSALKAAVRRGEEVPGVALVEHRAWKLARPKGSGAAE
jgi:hypothetical protein